MTRLDQAMTRLADLSTNGIMKLLDKTHGASPTQKQCDAAYRVAISQLSHPELVDLLLHLLRSPDAFLDQLDSEIEVVNLRNA